MDIIEKGVFLVIGFILGLITSGACRAELTNMDYALIYADAMAQYKQVHLDAQMPAAAPTVNVIDRDVLCLVVEHSAPCPLLGATAPRGFPGFEDADILLSHEADQDTPVARSVVYHEMIHYLQFQYGHATWTLLQGHMLKGVAGRTPPFRCIDAKTREREAYGMQARRLEEARLRVEANQVRRNELLYVESIRCPETQP